MIVISFEFGFLGGSMGVAAGERICRAFESAAEQRVPLVALTASGGARMQEGMLALSQMPATLAARKKLADAKMPFTCYLRNPTTGGVYASFASSADFLWAEPQATIGFAGPRVAETVTGSPLPEGSHTAEFAYDRCLIDALIAPNDVRTHLRHTLWELELNAPDASALPDEPPRDAVDAWQRVQRARASERPTGAHFLRHGFSIRRGGCDGSIATGVYWFDHRPVFAIAHDRRAGDGLTRVDGFRRARRTIAMAVRFGRPIVTFIDTPGADPSSASEGAGIAQEISKTFQALLEAPVPTVAVVVGEGGSGGALALAGCDRLLILENAIFSVIGPESAAAILRRSDISDVAGELKLTAHDLRELGLADRVLPEPSAGIEEVIESAVATAIGEISFDPFHEGPADRRLERWRVYR